MFFPLSLPFEAEQQAEGQGHADEEDGGRNDGRQELSGQVSSRNGVASRESVKRAQAVV